jgi:MFS transporter, DHA2 family, glioxin efflux transporter
MGNAIVLPAAQAIFQNRLLIALKDHAPGVDPTVVLAAGATTDGLSQFPIPLLNKIGASYVDALRDTFALGIPMAGIALIISVFMPWFKYHTENTDGKSDANKRVTSQNVAEPRSTEKEEQHSDGQQLKGNV